jgi:hypothetical protein
MANEIEVYKLDPSKWADAAAAFKTTGKYTDPVTGECCHGSLFNQQILKNMQMVQIHGDILIQIGLMPL